MRIGIDIGTHAAYAAALSASGRPELIRLEDGSTRMPALARQTMHGLIVGHAAAEALVGNAETTLVGCTRLMGRAGKIPSELLARLPYSVREVEGEAACNLLYAEVCASAVFGSLARALADAATAQLGAPVEEVVLTIPASAEDRFRVQARAAVEAHGLRVVRLINQPTAAILACGDALRGTVAVVSCSGGLTEVSLAERTDAGVQVLAVASDPLLGGDDMVWTVAECLNAQIQRTTGVDVFAVDQSRLAAQGLRRVAEEALRGLRASPEVAHVLDHGGGFGRDLALVVRRAESDAYLKAAYRQIGALCRRAMERAARRPGQVAHVLLIGEWADLPGLDQAVAKAFQRPVEALVVRDAAVLAVYGAAMAGADGAPGIWDVTPYPLGINCYYGSTELFSPIVAANTPIPTPHAGAAGAFTQSYMTMLPDQTTVRLDILQYRGLKDAQPQGAGRVLPNECEQLGSWEFKGLHPRPGQQAGFTVTFAVDSDGILSLVARETDTGHTLTARVERGVG